MDDQRGVGRADPVRHLPGRDIQALELSLDRRATRAQHHRVGAETGVVDLGQDGRKGVFRSNGDDDVGMHGDSGPVKEDERLNRDCLSRSCRNGSTDVHTVAGL